MTTSHDHPHINKAAPFDHPNHHPNNDNAATLPAQWTNDNGWQATWPAQQMNGYNRQQATSPAQQTQRPQTVSHLTSPMDEWQWWMVSHPTSPTDEWQLVWSSLVFCQILTRLRPGLVLTSRQTSKNWTEPTSTGSVQFSLVFYSWKTSLNRFVQGFGG